MNVHGESERARRAENSDRYVHHEYQHSVTRKLRRAARLDNWTRALYRGFAAKRLEAIKAALVATALLAGCASTKLAWSQCNANAELAAAASQVVSAEVQALECSGGDQSKVATCEEQFAVSEAKVAIGDAPLAVNDVLTCAADLAHDLAAAKTGQK